MSDKKPIYKRVWFIVTVAVIALVVVMSILGSKIGEANEAKRQAYLESLTPEQRDSLKAYEDSVAQHKAKQAADKKLQGKESVAYVFAKEAVSRMLKFPKTADFPLSPTYEQYFLGGIYDMRGTVEAQNAFGVPAKHVWSVRAVYNGGDQFESSSWTVTVKELQ